MTMRMPISLVYTIHRKEPELISPATPTPYETKKLSALDDQKVYRCQFPLLHFYRNVSGMEDPVKVIKRAIAETLVYYYPFAGRLREGPNDSLVVECTGEGVMFVEAKADVMLNQFGDILHPPFEGADDLLYDVPGSNGIVHCPLLLIQVTRFICGGFVFAFRLNHTMSDATGVVQFMTALAEITRGATVPSIQPVWKRELPIARDSPRITCVHHANDDLQDSKSVHLQALVHRSFFFGQEDIEILKKHVPRHIGTCTRFDVLTACLWRCRTISLKLDPNDEVRFGFFVDTRAKFNDPIPVGYYGNVIGIPIAVSTAGKLSESSLDYPMDLIKNAKAEVTDEFMRSTIDLLLKRNKPGITDVRTYYVSNVTHMEYKDLDFGWGKPLYGGPTVAGIPGSFFLPSKDSKGAEGIVVIMNLPELSMEKFGIEIKKLLSRMD